MTSNKDDYSPPSRQKGLHSCCGVQPFALEWGSTFCSDHRHEVAGEAAGVCRYGRCQCGENRYHDLHHGFPRLLNHNTHFFIKLTQITRIPQIFFDHRLFLTHTDYTDHTDFLFYEHEYTFFEHGSRGSHGFCSPADFYFLSRSARALLACYRRDARNRRNHRNF